MHHDFVPVCYYVALMVNHLRVFHPEINAVKTAINFHLNTEVPALGRVERLQTLQQGMSVPIRYFYGICFPVHVELNACHELIIDSHLNPFTRVNSDVQASS